MAPRTRQARRSHANDATQSDELADTKDIGPRTPSNVFLKSQGNSTIPRRRGRPPGSKNRPKTIATTPQIRRPRSRRLGRPPGSAFGNFEPPDIPAKQIARALNMFRNGPNTDDRVARASKRVFRYTKQWPWQWAVRFLPKKKWSVPLVEELAQLLRGIYKKSVNTNTGHGCFENTRRFLHNHARIRDRRNPQMILSDLHEAFRYFKVETKRELPHAHQTPPTTRIGRLTDLGDSDAESQHDEIATKEKNTNEVLTVTENNLADFNNNERRNENGPVISTGDSIRPRKRMLSFIDKCHLKKRSRVVDMEKNQVAQFPNSISPSLAAGAACRMSATATTTFADIVHAVAPLLAETEAKREIVVSDLSVLRQSTRRKKDAITRAATLTVDDGAVDKLRKTLQEQEDKREAIEKFRSTFHKSQSSELLSGELISQNIHYLNTQLQKSDETISQTKAEIQRAEEEASRSSRQELDRLETELKEDKFGVWQLEGNLKEIDQRLHGLRLLNSLVDLGSPGISTLITALERHGISLFDMISEIKTVSAD